MFTESGGPRKKPSVDVGDHLDHVTSWLWLGGAERYVRNPTKLVPGI